LAAPGPGLIDRITSAANYLNGDTLILITWDEGNGTSTKGVDCTDPAVSEVSCTVVTIVVNPYVTPGASDSSSQNLYSLLGTVEDILGQPRLGRAIGQPSMRTGVGL